MFTLDFAQAHSSPRVQKGQESRRRKFWRYLAAVCRSRKARAAAGAMLLASACNQSTYANLTDDPAPTSPGDTQLKKLSLEDLGKVEVTSVSKEPEQV
jgi:hypothetical protein